MQGRRFCCSDLHGCINLYNEINNFITPEDTVYFLGDAGDRGPSGWETIKAIAMNPQWVYLRGNHEDMLVHAMREYNYNRYENPGALVNLNGGKETFESWQQEEDKNAWIDILDSLPDRLTIKNNSGMDIILTHAGYTPPNEPDSFSVIWDRHHIFHGWPEGFDNTIMVHGHTTIPQMAKEFDKANKLIGTQRYEVPTVLDGALWYCGDHKVNIDCCSFVSGMTVLFDLDTFDEYIFY